MSSGSAHPLGFCDVVRTAARGGGETHTSTARRRPSAAHRPRAPPEVQRRRRSRHGSPSIGGARRSSVRSDGHLWSATRRQRHSSVAKASRHSRSSAMTLPQSLALDTRYSSTSLNGPSCVFTENAIGRRWGGGRRQGDQATRRPGNDVKFGLKRDGKTSRINVDDTNLQMTYTCVIYESFHR